ncbi:ABC transporter permease [Acrocarpospora macrocephala]|uniref:Autoinducer 2 import system permease protein LsrC n=1 Tax=Acrocarpospora macrocephala TaxID=150177 RepID=A0A5M3WVK4_9ACTN|nr:ABC transporter permease [Acrocarpospora macrocephala]GES12740.1 sugar ABC transporter permease [Acrocarpospora macrocephala]
MTITAKRSGTVLRNGGRGLVDRVARVRELGIVIALAVLFGVTGAVNPQFLGLDSLRDILLNSSIIAMLAVGQTLVVITRNVDLSVSSVVGLSAFGGALILAENPGLPIVVVVAGCVLLGAACGAINGLLVGAAKVPALVATLGTLYAFRGIDYAWAGGLQVNAADMPESFLSLGSGSLLGFPLLALVAIVVLLAVGWMLRNLRSGRELYAIGSNPAAAVLAGIPVRKRVITAFVASGALAGLAGAMWAARFGTVDAGAATGKELDVIAAVVVGGVAIFGGSGTVYGAALGALLLTGISSALAVLRVDALAQTAINGALIIAAIVLDRLLALRVAATLRRRRHRDAT